MNNSQQYGYSTDPEPIDGFPIDDFSRTVQNNNQEQPIDGIPLKYPIYEEIPYENSKWNDLFFLFPFVFQLVIVFVLGGQNMSTYSLSYINSDYVNTTTLSTAHFDSYILSSLCISVLLVYAIFGLMMNVPESFIRGANYILILFNFIAMAICFMGGIVGLGILFFLQLLIVGYLFYVAQVFIPFSTMLLKTSSKILNNNKLIFTIPIICLIFATYYTVFLLYAIIPSIEKLDNNDFGGYLILLFVLLFFWTQQVVSNVVNVTVAGIVGKWYYKNSEVTNVVWKAFCRAITKSLGSICFGSLLVTIIKTIQFIVKIARRDDNDCIMRCIDCLITFLERMMEYFNEYAYAYVGIYGVSYIESAKKTWSLVQRHFITAIFNDNLIYPVLLFSKLFVGFFTGLICWSLAQNLSAAIVCGIVGYVVSSVVMNLVHGSIVALFVCCIEDFNKLNENAPDLFNIINVTQIEIRRNNEEPRINRFESEV